MPRCRGSLLLLGMKAVEVRLVRQHAMPQRIPHRNRDEQLLQAAALVCLTPDLTVHRLLLRHHPVRRHRVRPHFEILRRENLIPGTSDLARCSPHSSLPKSLWLVNENCHLGRPATRQHLPCNAISHGFNCEPLALLCHSAHNLRQVRVVVRSLELKCGVLLPILGVGPALLRFEIVKVWLLLSQVFSDLIPHSHRDDEFLPTATFVWVATNFAVDILLHGHDFVSSDRR
mmetsp:Transcript_12675/g.25208  ORF Transcript_12675/g.25208 Transcript_12675/m.25208 type:complete len:230 (+) Transcript_12675:185-874(+)